MTREEKRPPHCPAEGDSGGRPKPLRRRLNLAPPLSRLQRTPQGEAVRGPFPHDSGWPSGTTSAAWWSTALASDLVAGSAVRRLSPASLGLVHGSGAARRLWELRVGAGPLACMPSPVVCGRTAVAIWGAAFLSREQVVLVRARSRC